MSLTPERPASSASRNGSLPMPMGETTPTPVTTTRLSSMVLGLARHAEPPPHTRYPVRRRPAGPRR